MKKSKAISLPKLKAKVQIVFNLFIRLRDKGKPCISCGTAWEDLQAGHFYSVRQYDGLRFNENNCHGECTYCNYFDDMHLLNYKQNLPERIGQDAFDELIESAHDYKQNGYKWSRTELLELLETYKQKVKELKK